MIVTYDIEEDKYPKNKQKRNNVEIIDLTDKTFEYSFNEERIDEKSARFGLVGGLLKNQPVIGGLVSPENCRVLDYPQQNCIILKQPNKTTYPLLEHTKFASSIVLNQKTLWVTGGELFVDSTEFVSVDAPTIKGPKFPLHIMNMKLHGHTMVQIDPKTIYVIGGGNDSNQKNTWIVDPNNVDERRRLILQKGPKMNHMRMHHCSSKMKIDDKVILVSVGGSCMVTGKKLNACHMNHPSKSADPSSQFHGLCLRKCFRKMLQNLPSIFYFISNNFFSL